MALNNLVPTINSFPRSPGVYLFRSKTADILYVGKSRSLRDRVSSYLQTDELEPSKQIMVQEINSIDYVVTDTETEALLLESTLIKKHRPPYNVVLRDDKSYSYICIDYSRKYPEIHRIRQNQATSFKLQASRLFGPFTSGSTAIDALWIVKKYFPVCLAPNKHLKRGCFNYAIHKCPGACIDTANPEAYKRTFQDVEQFLSGNTKALEEKLKHDIVRFSKAEQFEQAEIRKKLLFSIQGLRERQKVAGRKNENADYVSFVSFGKTGCVNILNIRRGSLYDQKHFLADHIQSPAETTYQILDRYYSEATDVPKTIYTTLNFNSPILAIDSALTNRTYTISIKHVMKGERLELLRMGERNAQEFLFRHSASLEAETSIEKLCQILRIPYTKGFRTEIYDISHIQGSEPVGSMVVFSDSDPHKSQYRKFKLEDFGEPNDFAHMDEILTRRFKHITDVTLSLSKSYRSENPKLQAPISKQIQNSKSQIPNELQVTSYKLQDSWALPNLIVIDGGKGQLSIARKILKHYELSIPMIALAKREEEIFIPGRADSLRLPRTNPALKLLQHMRDEAHRFGITFHRKRHRKTMLK